MPEYDGATLPMLGSRMFLVLDSVRHAAICNSTSIKILTVLPTTETTDPAYVGLLLPSRAALQGVRSEQSKGRQNIENGYNRDNCKRYRRKERCAFIDKHRVH